MKNPLDFMVVTLPNLPGALCVDMDPELFFPEKSETTDRVIELARICGKCPAKSECLQFAVDNRIFDGIWAGTSGQTRRNMVAKSKGQAPRIRKGRTQSKQLQQSFNASSSSSALSS